MSDRPEVPNRSPSARRVRVLVKRPTVRSAASWYRSRLFSSRCVDPDVAFSDANDRSNRRLTFSSSARARPIDPFASTPVASRERKACCLTSETATRSARRRPSSSVTVHPPAPTTNVVAKITTAAAARSHRRRERTRARTGASLTAPAAGFGARDRSGATTSRWRKSRTT